MKYLPLVWAALWRKPYRTILTFLSVTVAFILFGIVIGINASEQHLIALSHLDRIQVFARFGGPLPLADRDQIARLPGVTKISYSGTIPGYFRDKKNAAFAQMLGSGARSVMTEYPLSPTQWDELEAGRAGVFVSSYVSRRYQLKVGDAFPIMTAAVTRGDGTNLWPLTVTGIVDDIPQYTNGFILGNYTYWDQSRPIAQRGTVNTFQLIVTDANNAANTAEAIDDLFSNSGTPTQSITDRSNAENTAQAGINIPFVTAAVAGAGLFMILLLTGNGIAQSVRERIPEFAVLKTLGFSDIAVMGLVFVEAAIPCLLGAAVGLALATGLASQVPRLLPPTVLIPIPYLSGGVLAVAFAFAASVAFASGVIPALRIKRLNVAAALSGK